MQPNDQNPPEQPSNSVAITNDTALSPLDALLTRLKQRRRRNTKGAFGAPSLVQQRETKLRLKRALKRQAKASSNAEKPAYVGVNSDGPISPVAISG